MSTRNSRHTTLLLPVLVVSVLAAGCATGEAGAGSSGGGSAAAPTGSPVLSLASALSGTYRGTAPSGNDLRVDVTDTGNLVSGQAVNLFVRVSGTYEGKAVGEQGILHLENEGGEVFAAFIPRDEAGVGPLSPDALDVSPRELRSACTVYLLPRRAGYSGATQGGASCARALQGAQGTWGITIAEGRILLKSEEGRTLTFERAA